MPNWKSYDSSVRLLSAILAAHPELKLNYQEIAECFGDKTTSSSMQFRFRRIKADADAIKAARAQNVDPMTLDMDGGLCKEISKRYGGDCTVSALENRFRRVKGDAKALNDALANGIDPITISTDSLNGKAGKEIAKYYGECTASSLDHRFRPIKKEAQAMREGIADKFGEDTTAKAVSTRFERMKKEPGWLTNNNSGSNGSSNPTGAANGKAKPATPRKKKGSLGILATSSNEDDEENFDDLKPTPTKSVLNKTQGGRVGKAPTPRKMGDSFTQKMATIDVESDEEEISFKPEPPVNRHHTFGNGKPATIMDLDEGEDEIPHFFEANNGYASEGDVV